MATGEARLFIKRPAREIIDFVMDLRRYQKVDPKLGTIFEVRRTGDEVVFRFRPKLLGLPGPATTQRVVLTGGNRIDISGVPAWTDALTTFAAFFQFEDADGGTWVTRKVDFRFAKPVSWLLDPVFGRWLAKDVPQELARAKSYLERGNGVGRQTIVDGDRACRGSISCFSEPPASPVPSPPATWRPMRRRR
jgi:hypothetical protein